MKPKIAHLTVEGMKTVLRQVVTLEKAGLLPEEFEAKCRAIFAEQRIIDAPLIETFLSDLR